MKSFSVQHYMFRPLANEERLETCCFGGFEQLNMSKVIRCAPHATDYIVELTEFDVSIRKSLKRNAEFMKAI